MTNTPETPAQLNDLIRSIDARITTLQHERQVLVTQLQDIRRTAGRLLLAFLQAPDGHAQQGRELQLRQARLRAHSKPMASS